MLNSLSLRIRILLFFALNGLGGASLVLLGLWVGHNRLDPLQPDAAFVSAAVIGSLGVLGLSAWIWMLFDEHLAKPILRLAGGLRTHAHTDGAGEIDRQAARYLGDLAPAAQAVTACLAEQKETVDRAIEESTRDLEDERSRLAGLLAQVPAAVVLCNPDHRVMFYNGEAAELLEGAAPHLGRSIFENLRAEPVQAAYDRLQGAGDTECVCATLGNEHTLHVRMRRAETESGAGYALVLRALGRMSRSSERWPTTDFSAVHLLSTLRRQCEARGPEIAGSVPDLKLRGDPLQLAALLSSLAYRVGFQGGHAFTLSVEDEEPAVLRLSWLGAEIDDGLLAGWLEEDLDPGVSYVSGRSVLDLHRTDLWLEPLDDGRWALCMRVPRAVSETMHAPSLKAVFDFTIDQSQIEGSDRLSDQVFVVFDSETTGLDPVSDEVVQLAAVRMVNGRVITDEVFDTLVDPGRKIPEVSTRVHGISDEMVAGAPSFGVAGRRFHHFAQGAVLVAHNAPFDMAFLKRYEPEIGCTFDHPILDTVLLSAILYGQSEEHSLDALGDRLGVSIPAELRHTAMGDAHGTAQALERMLPMLEAAGLETLSDVIAAARAHGRLLKDLN